MRKEVEVRIDKNLLTSVVSICTSALSASHYYSRRRPYYVKQGLCMIMFVTSLAYLRSHVVGDTCAAGGFAADNVYV